MRTAETPWSIRIADVETGNGHELWHAAEGPGSAFHPMIAENQLLWAAGDRIVFPWEKTGYMHLYSISTHGDNPTALNTDDAFEMEDVSLSADGRNVIFNSNQNDIDRRQLWRVPVTGETCHSAHQSRPQLDAATRPATARPSHSSHPTRSVPRAPSIMTDSRLHDLAPDAIPSDFPATISSLRSR